MRLYQRLTVRFGITLALLITGGNAVSAQELSAPVWSSKTTQLSLFSSFAVLQALDGVSTIKALKTPGAYETNPVMGGLVNKPVAFFAVKAGITAGVIYGMRGFSKEHPKAAAIVMIALNSGYACVVGSNFSKVAGR